MDHKWIPVTERLPDNGQECWTFQPKKSGMGLTHGPHVDMHKFFTNWLDRGAMWTELRPVPTPLPFVSDSEDGAAIQVTHWQPFVRPSAPKD